jgi:8-amino-7-oxononanoate synthase
MFWIVSSPEVGILSLAAPARRPWLDHWLETVSDLEALRASHPMMDAVIDEVDGRMIRVGDRWLADFASCNYLGFDLDREIIAAVPAYLDAWGTHPSWSRLLGSPRLYEEIEARLTALLGAPDSLVLPTITHIHMSVIPVLAAEGTVFMDAGRTRRSTTAARSPRPAAPR